MDLFLGTTEPQTKQPKRRVQKPHTLAREIPRRHSSWNGKENHRLQHGQLAEEILAENQSLAEEIRAKDIQTENQSLVEEEILAEKQIFADEILVLSPDKMDDLTNTTYQLLLVASVGDIIFVGKTI